MCCEPSSRAQGQDRRGRAPPEPDSVLLLRAACGPGSGPGRPRAPRRSSGSGRGTARPAYRAPPARWRRPCRFPGARGTAACSSGTRPRSRSPRRRSRSGRSPSRGWIARARAAGRRRGCRRAPAACGRARSRRSRSGSSASSVSFASDPCRGAPRLRDRVDLRSGLEALPERLAHAAAEAAPPAPAGSRPISRRRQSRSPNCVCAVPTHGVSCPSERESQASPDVIRPGCAEAHAPTWRTLSPGSRAA